MCYCTKYKAYDDQDIGTLVVHKIVIVDIENQDVCHRQIPLNHISQ